MPPPLDVLPAADDEGVRNYVGELAERLKFQQLIRSVDSFGAYCHVATLAASDDAPLLVKVQASLFNAIKTCDAFSLMQQNFQSNAGNILEKLKVAYLYLQDGFPEFAKSEIDNISEDVEMMKKATDKCKREFEEATRALVEAVPDAAETEKRLRDPMIVLDMEKEEKPRDPMVVPAIESAADHAVTKESVTTIPNDGQTVAQQNDNIFIVILVIVAAFISSLLSQFIRMFRPRSENAVVAKDADTRQRLEARENHCRSRLITISLRKANLVLDGCSGVLYDADMLVNEWCKECKNIVEPNMMKNIQRAERLPEEQLREYWKSLLFQEQAYSYYRRWRALQIYCEESRPLLRRVRNTVEAYYTENLYPADALRRAWEVAPDLNDAEINDVISERNALLVLTGTPK